MAVAAKTLALTTLDLLTQPKNVDGAKTAFQKRKANVFYKSRIPIDAKPPLDYRGN